jgi:hypothetical protein
MKQLLSYIFVCLLLVTINAFVPLIQPITTAKKYKCLLGPKNHGQHYSLKKGDFFEVDQGPGHHLIEVDHDELQLVEKKIMNENGKNAKWLTFAWCLFILPIFIRSIFEVIYLI